VASLGDLLVLLHDAAQRARPARLTVTEWRHGPRSAEAWDRYLRARHGSTFAPASDPADDAQAESSWSVRLHYDGPERYREEAAGRQAGHRYVVRDGPRWLSWDADWGVVSSDSEPEGGPLSSSVAFLLDPVVLVGAFRFDDPRAVELVGRPALHVSARPRDAWDQGGPGVFRLGPGADQVELTFDAETGALLRSESRIDGKPFHRLDVNEIDYASSPPETFAVEPPPGHDEPPGPWMRPRRLPLHELAASAPFVLLVPSRVPDGWRLGDAQLLDGRERPRVEATAFLDYSSRDGAYALAIRERSARVDADTAAETTDRGETVTPRFVVTLVRSGTWVELQGDDRELLVDLVRALEPAPTEPPRL
jgi:hypothetical protein